MHREKTRIETTLINQKQSQHQNKQTHTNTLSDRNKYIYQNEEGRRAILLVQMYTLSKQIT